MNKRNEFNLSTLSLLVNNRSNFKPPTWLCHPGYSSSSPLKDTALNNRSCSRWHPSWCLFPSNILRRQSRALVCALHLHQPFSLKSINPNTVGSQSWNVPQPACWTLGCFIPSPCEPTVHTCLSAYMLSVCAGTFAWGGAFSHRANPLASPWGCVYTNHYGLVSIV